MSRGIARSTRAPCRRAGGHRGAAAAALLVATLLLPAPRLSAEAAPPRVPDAWEYVAMSPEQRHELRERVRLLPQAPRRAFDRALMEQVRSLPDWLYEALSNERVAVDCAAGRMGQEALPPPPELSARQYLERVPHQRYHFRLRARALPPQERQGYEARLAAELSTLAPWLQRALAEEAAREDARYGPVLCPAAP
ncbi:hypothetical protein [Pseudoxanthomonas broegbernensis]|uniref:hypothetical protein n=1 Tax=Pseudoxanthomonas broegbernensis TaxID=83619 RepID=UPI001391EC6F|nr:hypothetical protein [Pseudoxanthomonas broegbernensis]MBB6066246.1 hypothetical protein [Pseudoxanthomonas broegbernensis]